MARFCGEPASSISFGSEITRKNADINAFRPSEDRLHAAVGLDDGWSLGDAVGNSVGAIEGTAVGTGVGISVGVRVGADDADSDGCGV